MNKSLTNFCILFLAFIAVGWAQVAGLITTTYASAPGNQWKWLLTTATPMGARWSRMKKAATTNMPTIMTPSHTLR
ncbi:hypothetical protein [Verrucomicrobium spinosum]|uniref:hypothetical protein n=1 Tax=Verrucomicrobium spinosum TaxID=2736 RepID=UPI00155D9B5A|nr:hypothetical protein [Verrucomicrobium spinosum]